MIKRILIITLLALQINSAKSMQWLRPSAIAAISFGAGIVASKLVPKFPKTNFWRLGLQTPSIEKASESISSALVPAHKTNNIISTISSFAKPLHNFIVKHPMAYTLSTVGLGCAAVGIYCYHKIRSLKNANGVLQNSLGEKNRELTTKTTEHTEALAKVQKENSRLRQANKILQDSLNGVADSL